MTLTVESRFPSFDPTTGVGCRNIAGLLLTIGLITLVVTSILMCTGDLLLYHPDPVHSIVYSRTVGLPISIIAGGILLMLACCACNSHAHLHDRCSTI